ncbi:MAG: HAD family phosphatase [Bacteroidales bacterium]|jgi:HAD superfamily hydrolase (TIGR01509 family)|nr:HAD family phosphatase [Bacteroidales bacterium]
MIRNIILDFGKVLVDYDFDIFFRRYVPDENRRKQFVPILYNDGLTPVVDRGEKPFEEIVDDLIAENPEFEPELRIFSEHYPDLIIGEIPGMKNLLKRLKTEGFKLYGLSNWCSKVYITMEQYDIFNLLDGYIISSEVHKIKPEPGIYQSLFDRFSLKPEECVFADDKEENVEASIKEGMPAIVFKNAEQFETELRKLL